MLHELAHPTTGARWCNEPFPSIELPPPCWCRTA